MVHFRTHPRRLCTHTPPSFLGLATTSGYPRLQRTWPHITTYTCDHFSDGVCDYGRLRHTHTGDCGGRVNGSYDGSRTPLCPANLHCSRPAQGRPASTLSFPANVDIATSLGQFIATCNLVLGEILVLCDDSEKQSFDRPPWVVGWDAPLQKCFRKALSAPQVMISPLPRLIDDFFIQLRRELDVDDSGPSAYRKLLSLLTAHFDDGDQGRAFEQLHSFGVPDLTEFSAFLRAFKQRVSIVQGTERLFKPSDAMVIEICLLYTSPSPRDS